MPTQTFYNLSKRKKQRIIDASLIEFNEKSLSDASIARIVKNANISRGSFYQYFEGKKDLFFYVIGIFRQKYHDTLIQSFKNNEGDFFMAFSDFGSKYISSILNSDNFGLFENIHLHMSEHINRMYGYHPKQIDYPDMDKERSEMEFTQYVDFNQLHIESEDELLDIFKFLIDILNDTIMEGNWRGFSVEVTQENFQKRLRWVFYGVYNRKKGNGDER